MEGQYVSLNIPQKINLTICGVEVFGSQVESAPVPPPAPRYNFPNASAQIGGRTVWLLGGRLCWSDALLYCRRHHWDLLSIHSQDEQMQVEQLIAHTSLSPLSDHVWLGLRREVMGMRWFWMSGEAVTFDNWRMHPPVFPNPCGGMERDTSLWSPLPCGENNNFLCQSAPAQNTTKVYYYSSKDPMP
ncbi:snaclec bitiscetin subunit alpha [Periophthalmus magnuspinnatus]|uniref:snaclec bitiscetin subunit alpha n=1 Tax=Periophthalmus magnuspinnatus TaxID=409849 RepID=UPI0024365AC4|nr:snaclec bitiscetin subunit alpha [Periophthalmus magnuspinnatus]